MTLTRVDKTVITRRRFLRRAMAVSTAVAVLSTAAACGAATPTGNAGSNSQPAASPSSPTARSEASPSPSAPAASVGASALTQTGQKSLAAAISVEPQGLDYNYNATPGALNVAQNIFSYLVRANPDSGEVQGDAATAWESVDPTTWQFKLRSGITFHNGEKLDANSVKVTVDTLLSDKVPASSIVKGRVNMIQSVQVPDPSTVVFKLNTPTATFPSVLYEVPIYPAKLYAEEGIQAFNQKPIGSGPFKFVSWQKGTAITLARFDDYFGGKAKLDQVVFKPMTEKSSRIAALQAGEVQMAMDIDPDDVAGLRGQGFQIASGSYGESWDLTFMTKPGTPLTDIRVRQAINYAIDRETLVKTIFGGLTRTLNEFCGPDAFGYNPNVKGYSYDVAKAKSLLQEAGVGNGFSIGFDSGTTGGVKVTDVAQYLVAQLQKVGIKANLNLMERGAFSAKIRDGSVAPMYLLGWFYWPQMDSQRLMDFVPPDKPYKRFFSSSELEAVIKQADGAFDTDKRRQLLQQANQMFFDLAPVAFLYQGLGLHALAKNVQGLRVTPDTVIRLGSVSLS